ncbi:SemiSWEET family sugar transporter [Silanimonas lenta]|jgi:MtN3 and saliva related transmembrane protein|uniref:SemiSWEET family sugar transporter n=1 Tax=Silanimonas lenta TaxID=265429 RepID=UPI00048D5587|nr:SemiSWEET transporter [Silanimonas lenta]
MDPITLLGLVAAFLTSVAFVPQVVRNFRRRQVGDLSVATFGTFTLGVLLWLAYGIAIDSLPIIFANVFTLSVQVLNLWQMWRYRQRPGAAPR